MQDVFIACAGGLIGINDALSAAFPDVMVQTCIVHMVRNSTKFVSYKDRKPICAGLEKIYSAVNETEAQEHLDEFCRKWDSKYSMIRKSWRQAWDRIIPLFLFPEEIWRTIYTISAVESVDKTLRRASRNHW